MVGAASDGARVALADLISQPVDSAGVDAFVPGPGIVRLPGLRVDIARLRTALDELIAKFGGDNALDTAGWDDTFGVDGFGVLPLTRRPGTDGRSTADLSGRYWIRPDDTYTEVARDEDVDEAAYTEVVPEVRGTYFADVLATLRAVAPIGRARINLKAVFNANSWHRDPEPRLHIPIITNPGALFAVNHHVTHLPADGSVYFTDTRGYHTALNGGEHPRVHLVVSLPAGRITAG